MKYPLAKSQMKFLDRGALVFNFNGMIAQKQGIDGHIDDAQSLLPIQPVPNIDTGPQLEADGLFDAYSAAAIHETLIDLTQFCEMKMSRHQSTIGQDKSQLINGREMRFEFGK
jgi:hypothetical protein